MNVFLIHYKIIKLPKITKKLFHFTFILLKFAVLILVKNYVTNKTVHESKQKLK